MKHSSPALSTISKPFSWLDESPESPLHAILTNLGIAANLQLPVLILGESGVGKEVLARELHQRSPRNAKPFVAVNCGSLHPGLLESTLFGSTKGAFTGAHQETLGLIRSSDGGTLFLDEIGELPMEAQSRLLRVLQERTVTPVGSHSEIPVNFRLVCATHRNLRERVSTGLFREDLFYRICAFPIDVPPLRSRMQDIEPIARALWLQMIGSSTSLPCTSVLRQYSWPGNIRQLRNVLERFAALQCTGATLAGILHEECIHGTLREPAPESYRVKRIHTLHSLQNTLANCDNNKSLTARTLGISRGSLCHHLRKFGLS